jgi:dTDP-4-amino-4,6-dideoxygalactose transaminase
MIPHSRPSISEDDARAVSRVIETGMLAAGVEAEAFERDLASYVGLSYAVSVSSGTAGLYLALRALGVGNGDEVVIPAYVCSALWHAVRMAGAVPVLADTGGDGVHPDGATVRAVLTPKTKAVVFAHLFGGACDIGDIIAAGVPVIEDCAMSLGAEYAGRKAGALGSAASVFSFYATKVIAAGEGGMVLSGDRNIAERVRDLSEYADKLDGTARFNLRMSDVTAALGRSQLGRLESFIARRRDLAARYAAAFQGLGAGLPSDVPGGRHIFYRYAVNVPDAGSFRTMLVDRGIRAERPVHMPLSRINGVSASCPGAERAWSRVLSIPLYPSLSDAEADTIIRAVRETAPLCMER